jgi:small-conductance mechanosensitive channel
MQSLVSHFDALRRKPARRWHGLVAILLAALLLAPTSPVRAEAAPPPAQTVDDSLDQIRQLIDGAQESLKDGDRLDDTELQALRSTALAAQAQATQIAGQLAPQLAGIQARVAELGPAASAPAAKEDPDVAAQRSLLAKNNSAVDAQLKLARLLAVEGEQLAAQLTTMRRLQFQARLGERTHSILARPFWAELRDDLPRDARRLSALGSEIIGAAHGTPWPVKVGAPLGVIAAIAALRWLRRRALVWLTTRAPAGRLRRSIYAVLVVLDRTLGFGAVAAALYAMLDWNRTLSTATETLLSNLSGTLWFSGFMYGLWSALLCARRSSWRLPPVPDSVAAKVRWFPPVLTAVSLATWLAERLAVLANASLSMTVTINCVVALALGLTVVLALMRGERAWRLELVKDAAKPRPVALAIVAGLNWLVLASAVICLLVGYVAFGSFAIKQVVWASIVLGACYLLSALVDDVLMAWLVPPREDKASDEPTEGKASAQIAVLASGLIRLALLLVALMLLLAPFGEGPSDLLRRSGQWQQGLKVGEFVLQPGTVLQALVVLVCGLGVVRLLRRWLAKSYLPTTSLDPGMRSSATSLFGYAGVVVAISLAMSAMGVGLERIAWVASALSVGIGFGLQAVVQNFVSGLILLAERPVKVGDWVSLSGVEGDIRRINVRATEIQMGDRSTVIVPNSEFITKIVRNVTLANPIGLVQLKLPVPVGSDPEQVKMLLLAAFDAHGDVLDTPGPAVLLDGVEGGQLMFNATGYANSPRIAGRVRSELLFDVLKRLSEAGITLSRPPTMLINAPAPGPAAAA